MTTEVKLPEYGPEPIKLTSAMAMLIANGIQISNPAAAKALARELIELKRQLAEEKDSVVVIVRPTQSELYDRALSAYNLLDTQRTERCKPTPENEAWFELYWCLINLKPK
jgi:hypothetical protein